MRRPTRKRSKSTRKERRSVSTSTRHHRETARFRRLNDLLAKRIRRLRLERSMTIEQAIEAEAQAQAICMQTEDFRRAYEAFAAKQKPVFQGD